MRVPQGMIGEPEDPERMVTRRNGGWQSLSSHNPGPSH